jgi:hypothetical protein
MMSEDKVPFDVIDNFPDTGDLSDQQGGDVIDACKSVRFKVENATPRINERDGEKLTATISVRASVGALGIDGDGKYKGKNFFVDLITWVNTEVLTSDWWQKQSRFPYKQFLKAIDFDPATPPKVTDEFLTGLAGKEFIADIRKAPVRMKNEDGKYVATGEFKNELANFKKAE